MIHTNHQPYYDEYDSEEEVIETRELLTMTETKICDVWASNFEEEMNKILNLL